MFDWLPNTSNTINATGAGNAAGLTGTATLNNRWLTTATGKLGYAWDRVLLYGKGGGAWVGNSNPSFTVNNVGAAPFSSSNSNNFGWTAGLGVDGLSRATGQPEPSGTTSGYKTKALRSPAHRPLEALRET